MDALYRQKRNETFAKVSFLFSAKHNKLRIPFVGAYAYRQSRIRSLFVLSNQGERVPFYRRDFNNFFPSLTHTP